MGFNMNKIYRLHDYKGKFIAEFSSLEICKKCAELLYGTSTLHLAEGHTEKNVSFINVEVIKENVTIH